MTLLRVPVQLASFPDPDRRRDFAADLMDALNPYAAHEMTILEGEYTVAWDEARDLILVVVDIDDPSSVAGSATPEIAARTIVTSALFDMGLDQDAIEVLTDEIQIIPAKES